MMHFLWEMIGKKAINYTYATTQLIQYAYSIILTAETACDWKRFEKLVYKRNVDSYVKSDSDLPTHGSNQW